MNDFGQKILEIRRQRNITQQELGKIIGVDKRVISKYEKGSTVPSVKVALQIATALDTSLDYLMGSDKALFIDDNEVIQLLKNYNGLTDDVKLTVKNMLKALTIYNKVSESI
jgi:transcriptional regulator with XRE-family HTH domain